MNTTELRLLWLLDRFYVKLAKVLTSYEVQIAVPGKASHSFSGETLGDAVEAAFKQGANLMSGKS